MNKETQMERIVRAIENRQQSHDERVDLRQAFMFVLGLEISYYLAGVR